jgi:hypothetical protein
MAYNAGSNQDWALNTSRVSVAVNNSVDLTNLDWCSTCGVCNNYNLLIDSYFMNKTDEASAFMLCYCTNDLTDESLINLINRVARAKSEGPFLTLLDAMDWAITNGVFVTNQNYPSIVTSGNTLNLDAGLPSSYPKTGTVWYDLTNNPNNNGTLVNGVTYNSGSKGYLSFNGINRYISFTTPTNIPIGNSNYTISIWFMPGSISIGTEGLVGWGNYGTTNQVNAFKLTPTGLSNYWWANDLSVTTTLSNGNWYNAVATFDGTTRSIWVNGVLLDSDTPIGHNVPNANNLTIGLTNTTEYYTGIISEVQIFNRGLTSNEIVSNYNALLTRYNGSDTNICVTPTYCPVSTQTPTPTPTNTRTQTPTPTKACPVTLNSVTLNSGTNWNYFFTSAASCGTIITEISSDGITWSTSGGACTSPRVHGSPSITTGLVYFRVTQICSVGGPTISNVITASYPTPTPTPTNTATQTPTPTGTPPVVCDCYSLYYTSPISGPVIEFTTYQYTTCDGNVTTQGVSDLVGTVDVCAREGSISKISGDGTGGWDPSLYDCCLGATVVTWSYKATFGLNCTGGAITYLCTDDTDICLSSVIYSADSGGCLGGSMASGWYANLFIGPEETPIKRFWNGTSWGGACTLCTGCLVADTIITLSDGSTKLIQDIQVGDVLKSIYVSGMPQPADEWYSWSSDTLNYVSSTSTVVNFTTYEFDSVVNINNGRLIATDSHNHVVKQNGVWYIRTTSELNVGDVLLDIDNTEFEITSLITIIEPTTVYDVDVNNSNLYFANNVLTHNK